MNRRTLTLVVVAVLAIGAGLLCFDYLLSVNHNAPSAPPRSVLVATKDIPARSTITAANVSTVSRPSNTVDPSALGKASDIKPGSIAFVTIPAGSTITSSIIGPPASQSLPVQLRPGMRAISIQVDIVKAIAGLVQPGDYVDVVASPPRAGEGQPKAYTILRRVRVLAVGSSVESSVTAASPAPQGPTEDPRTITLEVPPDKIDLITMADINATLRLALRSPQDRTGALPPENLVFAYSAPSSAGPASAQNGSNQNTGKPSQVRRSLSPITVIDGDTVETTTEK